MSSLKNLINDINNLNIHINNIQNQINECNNTLNKTKYKCYTKGLKWNANSCAFDSIITSLLFPKNKYIRQSLKNKNKDVRYNISNTLLLELRKQLDNEIDNIISHIDNPRKTIDVSCTNYRRILREIRNILGLSPIKYEKDKDFLNDAVISLIDEYDLNITMIDAELNYRKYDIKGNITESRYFNNVQEIIDSQEIRDSNIVIIDYFNGIAFENPNKIFDSIDINGKTLYLHAIPFLYSPAHFCAYIKCDNNWYLYNGSYHNSNKSWQGPIKISEIISDLSKRWNKGYDGSYLGIYWDSDEFN